MEFWEQMVRLDRAWCMPWRGQYCAKSHHPAASASGDGIGSDEIPVERPPQEALSSNRTSEDGQLCWHTAFTSIAPCWDPLHHTTAGRARSPHHVGIFRRRPVIA